jgi:hypothetical protein
MALECIQKMRWRHYAAAASYKHCGLKKVIKVTTFVFGALAPRPLPILEFNEIQGKACG